MAPATSPRWSVQVLAGPALTYRYLGPATSLSTSATPSAATPGIYSVAGLERPALGYGGQLSVRRVLNRRWAVSAGLGYAEYATRLAIQRVGALPTASFLSVAGSGSARSNNASATIHRRDTYRFLAVPLRVSYSLARGTRWHMGLVGGVELAAYLGGTSTEGTACACQTQTWGATGSPYRRLSLGANLGAELRYHLTDRLELLAQPTATYFLNSLPKPANSYSQRYLLGGTALLGISYDFP